MRPGILPEHGFKHKGNHYASLPWFGTKIAQKYAIKGSKFSGFRRDVKPHVLTFSTSGRRLVTTFCTCAMSSQKKCRVSGCRRQAGDVCCLRCLIKLLNDVRAHCYCASLVRTLFIGHARATSFSSARTESKTQQNIELMTFALTWCANIFVGCSVTPTFFSADHFLF